MYIISRKLVSRYVVKKIFLYSSAAWIFFLIFNHFEYKIRYDVLCVLFSCGCVRVWLFCLITQLACPSFHSAGIDPCKRRTLEPFPPNSRENLKTKKTKKPTKKKETSVPLKIASFVDSFCTYLAQNCTYLAQNHN